MTLAEFDLKSPTRRDMCDRAKTIYARAPQHLSVAELRLAQRHLGVDPLEYHAPVSGLVIGECPGPNSHWALPLFPWPYESSAGRLMAMSKLSPAQYLGGLYRRNLVDDQRWLGSAARNRARELLTALFDHSRKLRVVLLGLKVADAFGVRGEFWSPTRLDSRQRVVVVPHPSGLNRMYNDATNRRLTGRWVRWAAIGEDEP